MLTVASCDPLAGKGRMGIWQPTATSAPAGTRSPGTPAVTLGCSAASSPTPALSPGGPMPMSRSEAPLRKVPVPSGTCWTSGSPEETSWWWPPSTGSAVVTRDDVGDLRRSPDRLRAQGLRAAALHLVRRGTVGGRYWMADGPEGQEPGRAADGGGHRGHSPIPGGGPARRHRSRSSGVRSHRRGPANWLRASAQAVDLGDGFNGHSSRIGIARRWRPDPQCRWKHGYMVVGNTRGEAAR